MNKQSLNPLTVIASEWSFDEAIEAIASQYPKTAFETLPLIKQQLLLGTYINTQPLMEAWSLLEVSVPKLPYYLGRALIEYALSNRSEQLRLSADTLKTISNELLSNFYETVRQQFDTYNFSKQYD